MTDSCFEAMTKAKNQYESGNFRGAVDTLESYLKTDPHNTEPRLYLAKLCAQNDNVDYAVLQLDIILDLQPENVEARKALVTLVKVKKRNNDETLKHFEYLEEHCPDDADIMNSFAIFCKMQLTDFERAASLYEKAIALKPDDASYRINYAILLVKDLKDYVKGKEQLEIGIKLDPNNYQAQTAYAKLMKKKFDSDGNLKKGLFSFLRKKQRWVAIGFLFCFFRLGMVKNVGKRTVFNKRIIYCVFLSLFMPELKMPSTYVEMKEGELEYDGGGDGIPWWGQVLIVAGCVGAFATAFTLGMKYGGNNTIAPEPSLGTYGTEGNPIVYRDKVDGDLVEYLLGGVDQTSRLELGNGLCKYTRLNKSCFVQYPI